MGNFTEIEPPMTLLKALVLFFFPLLGLLQAHAGTYYVSALSGDDGNGDGSQENPWKTITFALTQVPGQMDRIIVRPGIYEPGLGEVFPLLMKEGVSIRGEGKGEAVISSGDRGTNVIEFPSEAFSFQASLESLVIEGGACGILVSAAGVSTQPRILSCTIRDNALDGICLRAGGGGTNIAMVHSNSIHSNGEWGIGVFPEEGGEAVPQVENNEISCNSAGGIGIFTQDGSRAGGKVRYNTIHDNGSHGVFVKCEGPGALADFSLQSCVICGNSGSGVLLVGEDSAVLSPHIGTSTIAFQGIWGIGLSLTGDAIGDPVVANTILWANGRDLEGLSSSQVSFCLISDGTFVGENFNINEDPLFVNAPGRDFHVQLGSPVVDAGDRFAPGVC